MNEQYLGVGGRMVTVGGKAIKMPQGVGGRDGVTFTPAVSAAGDLSWTNDGGLANPQTVNLKGPKGDTGARGPAGADGKTPVKGTDYFTPTDVNEIAAEAAKKVDISGKLDKPTNDATATAGQLLTKTANGQEWQDREKDLFVVTISGNDSSGYTADKTFSEIKAAYDKGKTVVATTVVGSMTCPLFLVYVAAELVQFTAALFDNVSTTLSITVDKNNNIARHIALNQAEITASGILKGDGIGGISAATAGTDYMVPPTGGTVGQVLTKTTDGQEWQDREKDLFIVTISVVSNTTFTADKTFLEIQEAYDAGKVCFASMTGEVEMLFPIVQLVKDTIVIFSALVSDLRYQFLINANNSIEGGTEQFQEYITATGLLKGNGDGGVRAAVAGTDYMVPPTGGTVGQVLTKTADGQKWQSVNKDNVGLGNVDNVKQYSVDNPPPYPVTSVNGKTGAVTISVPTVPSTTSLIKGNGSGGLVAATRGSDYIASGNIVKQTLVSTESTPTENYAINWVYG